MAGFSFWIIFIPFVVSLPCLILTLISYFLNRNYRTDLHNHPNLLILPITLVYELGNLLFSIHFSLTGQLLSTSIIFRTFWGFIDWTFLTLQFFLVAWATIERHILIFHSHLVSTKIKRFFVHYLPLIMIPCYCCVYYPIVIFSFNCQNVDPSVVAISFVPCAFVEHHALYVYETLIHQIFPIFLIVIASAILLIRVILQKYRFHHKVRWRQHRRMTIQLLSISFIYLLFPTPYCIVILLNLAGVSISNYFQVLDIVGIFVYYAILFNPVICFASMPELHKILRKVFRQRLAVGPANAPIAIHR